MIILIFEGQSNEEKNDLGDIGDQQMHKKLNMLADEVMETYAY